MTTLSHGVRTSKTKALTTSHNIGARISGFVPSEAVQVVNKYLMDDTDMKALMGGDFNIYPLVASETPYIRYVWLPVNSGLLYLREDIVRYYVGHTDIKKLGEITEKIKELLIIDDSYPGTLPLSGGRFFIQSIQFLGGNPPSGPDQDNGVVEANINFALIYTII